jgi:hypothetical protein
MNRTSIKIPVVVFLLVTLFVFLPRQKANAWGGGGGQCFDFVTIGGFFYANTTDGPNTRVNFGGNAGFKNGDPPPPLMAHLTVEDHNSGRQIKIDGTSNDGTVTCYGASDPESSCRRITGRATTTKGGVTTTGTFQCTICDFGEPGNSPKGSDLFGIRVIGSDGTVIYDTDLHTLQGGNAQLHKPCSTPTPGCF